jgi:hypothetical protein
MRGKLKAKPSRQRSESRHLVFMILSALPRMLRRADTRQLAAPGAFPITGSRTPWTTRPVASLRYLRLLLFNSELILPTVGS